VNEPGTIRVTPAPWEQKTLGLHAVEIDVRSPRATLDMIQNASVGYDLSTVKIPSGNPALVHSLEAIGYRFMESQLSLGVGLRSLPEPSPLQRAILKKYCLTRPKPGDLETLLGFITQGLFTSDRVTLDPELGKDLAIKRYVHWITDVLSRDTDSMQWISPTTGAFRHAGFIIVQKEGETIHALLGGVFPRYQILGAGLAMVLHPIRHFASHGFAFYTTRVSSNNLPVVNLYLEAGFSIKEIVYVLRRLERRGRGTDE